MKKLEKRTIVPIRRFAFCYLMVVFSFFNVAASLCQALTFDDTNNLIVNGTADNGFDSWTYINNVSVYTGDSASGTGNKCFQISGANIKGELVHSVVSVTAGENLQVGLSFKTLSGTTLPSQKAYLCVRYWNASNVWLGQDIIELSATNDAWQLVTGQVVVWPGATVIDIYVVIGLDNTLNGTARFDDVFLYRAPPTPPNTGATDPSNGATDPSNGATLVDTGVVLKWSAPAGVTNPEYNVYLCTDPNSLGNSMVASNISQTQYDPYPSLDPNTNYYWRVDVVGGATGDVWTFKTYATTTLHAIAAPTKLYVVTKSSLSNAKFIMVQTLQGVVARTKPEIYIDEGDSTYLDDLVSNYGITYTRVSDSNVMSRFASRCAGYVLYDLTDANSITTASAMAAKFGAVAADVTIESYVAGFGLTKLADVRGKTDKWVFDNYWNDFAHNGILVKDPRINMDGSAYYFRDWNVTNRQFALWNYNRGDTDTVLDRVDDSSPVFGWQNAAVMGEMDSISYHSQNSLYCGPVAAVLNMSTLAGMANRSPVIPLQQKIHGRTYTRQSNVHYVAFKLSDMDNLGTELGAFGFHLNSSFWANSNRGTFKMGWGMPPSLVELAPSVAAWWYRSATSNDGFSAPTSGLGYTYPSKFPALKQYARHLGRLMQTADLHTLVISDALWPANLTYDSYKDIAKEFASIPTLRGMFYLDVNGDYARYNGKILWFDGKPLVTTRYTLWNHPQYEGISRTGAQLAASINALPTDPNSPDSYTFVIVHAWTYGLNEVKACIALLNPNVRVVTPDELIEQLYLNMCPTGDASHDCHVNFLDFAILAESWLKIGNLPDVDFDNSGKIDSSDLKILSEHWLAP